MPPVGQRVGGGRRAEREGAVRLVDSPGRLVELERRQPALRSARAILSDWVAGLLLAAGVLEIAVAWFGLRSGAWGGVVR